MQQRVGETIDEFRVRRRAYEASRYANDPTYRARKKVQSQRFRALNPERKKAQDLYKNYGITLEQRDAMLKDQNGACAICSTDEPGRGKDWNVDHCHPTETVRGILCVRCNFMIGHSRDNPEVLRKAADYLEKHRGTRV